MDPIVLVDVHKTYQMAEVRVPALCGLSLTVRAAEFMAIMGPSGSGKSTLMHVIGCLDTPTAGVYLLEGIDVARLSDDALAEARNQKIGFVFQAFNLLPRTSALENVMLPLYYRRAGLNGAADAARAALAAVGLAHRASHLPSQMSGGEQQRVAIARALVTQPTILLADEPTGNLDTSTSHEVMEIIQRLNREQGLTIVLVTHERDIAAYATRIITLRDGRIVRDEPHVAAGVSL